jgi:tetraacyldisaccharide 4'-kinase
LRPVDHHWFRLSWLSVLLLPLALVFAGLTAVRRLLYRIGALRSEHLRVPVIVVGNIIAGGAGKTPLVLWLAGHLTDAGYRPGIITRGYSGTEDIQAVSADADPKQAGDEPVLLARRSRCPVWTGRDRAAAGRALLAHHPEVNVLVSDDGLQHYRLARDLEIAVVDGELKFGNGLMIPAGPLREPRARLRSVDAVVVNGGAPCGLPHAFSMRLSGQTFVNLRDTGVTRRAAEFAGMSLHAVAGIGNPQRFFATLSELGLRFAAHAFPDHHRFRADELDFPGAQAVLMTEKDAVKCTAFARSQFWFLPVDAVVDRALGELLLDRLRTRPLGTQPLRTHHGPKAP